MSRVRRQPLPLASTKTDRSAPVRDALSVSPGEYKLAYAALMAATQGEKKKTPSAPWPRGLLQAKQAHVGSGSVFTLYSGHSEKNERFSHILLHVEFVNR